MFPNDIWTVSKENAQRLVAHVAADSVTPVEITPRSAFIDTLADVTAQIDGYRRELESVTALIVARRESQYAAERYAAAIRGHLDALHDRRRELEARDV